MKMPDPIIDPATIMVESSNPNPRTKCVSDVPAAPGFSDMLFGCKDMLPGHGSAHPTATGISRTALILVACCRQAFLAAPGVFNTKKIVVSAREW
jgi:hypothetical protein